ncbi:MAG: hypothetical protein AB7T06_18405 [Kofleriaceae bacterium]
MRQVRGVLFVDYVRMLRSTKVPTLTQHLTDEELSYLTQAIDKEAWYPMHAFEKLGCAILAIVARNEMFPVRLWGRYSATQLHKQYPTLLSPNDPVETLNRFRVLRETFFDFPALAVPLLNDEAAQITINYHMGNPAEEAASYQTMGFFEGLLELAGCKDIHADFRTRSWKGEGTTLLALQWQNPSSPRPSTPRAPTRP